MFKRTLRTAGLYLDDPRLNELSMNLTACQNFIIEHAEESDHPENHFIDFECFKAWLSLFLATKNYSKLPHML